MDQELCQALGVPWWVSQIGTALTPKGLLSSGRGRVETKKGTSICKI